MNIAQFSSSLSVQAIWFSKLSGNTARSEATPTEICKHLNKLFPVKLLIGRISFRFCVNEYCLSVTGNGELHFALYSLDRLWAGWSEVRITAGARYLFCYQKYPDRLWGPSSFLFTEYRSISPGVKRPGREAIHSPPPIAQVKNEWSYTSAPPIFLHSIDSDKFTLYCWLE